MPPTESPLEDKLYLAMPWWMRLVTWTQFTFGDYRADFALPWYRLIIEVDGKEWHNSEAQVASDKRRDRFAAHHGWTVIRFTGTEVYHHADTVILEIEEICHRRWWWIFWTIWQ